MANMFATRLYSFNRWRWPAALLFLTLFALLIRWYYVSTALVINPIRGDATQYVSYAWNVLTHRTFSKDLPGSASIMPDSYRDPGYPFFLAMLMKVFGIGDTWYGAVLLCQALLGALTVTLATQLGKSWLTGRWALTAGLLMAVWPHSISITGVLLSETLLSFLCAAALLIFAVANKRQSAYWGAASGVLLGTAALTNAVLLPFGILLAVMLGWRRLATRALCAAMATGALLLPCCWAVRNSHLPPAIPSNNSSRDRALQNFAQGASPEFHDAYRNSLFGNADQRKRAAITLRAVEADYALLKESLQRGLVSILQHFGRQPFRFAFWYFIEKPNELWGWNVVIGQGDIYVYPTVSSPFQTDRPWIALEAFCRAINLLLMLAGAFSLLALLFSSRFGETVAGTGSSPVSSMAVAWLLAFITFVYCALQEEPRYSIPFRPFEILMAITTLAVVSRQWSHRNRPQRLSH